MGTIHETGYRFAIDGEVLFDSEQPFQDFADSFYRWVESIGGEFGGQLINLDYVSEDEKYHDEDEEI